MIRPTKPVTSANVAEHYEELDEGEYHDHLSSAGLKVTRTENLIARVKHTWDLVIANMARHFTLHPSELMRALRRPNRDFFWTPFRMRTAYELGVLDYALIAGHKAVERRSLA